MNKMKKAFTRIKCNVCDVCDKLVIKTAAAVHDTRGDLAANTIGAIIVAVVIIGLLIVAVHTFFPGFFGDMFAVMKTKLTEGWNAGWKTVTP